MYALVPIGDYGGWGGVALLIYCPNCRCITYAAEVYDEFDEVVGYRCMVCGNVFGCDQVNVAEFPEVSFIIRGGFADFIAEVEGVSKECLIGNAVTQGNS